VSQESAEPLHPDYRRLLLGPLVLIAALVVARFVLEAEGISKDITRFVSASVGGVLILIYLGAVAPLRGITRFRQLAIPALVLTTWTGVWDALSLTISGILRLPGSHFADAPGILHNWQHLAMHVLVGHLGLSLLVGFPFDFGLLSLLFLLRRWPVIVAPSAVLGGLVTLRFAAEAMNLAPMTASAWSSSVGVLLSAFYLGGIGPRMGLVSARQLLAPSLVLGWVWRFWVFLAALFSVPGLYKTHFFDSSQGRLAVRLLQLFGGGFIVAGAVAGLLVWGIAVWTSRVIQPARSD
jgi:hypothetical protein